VRGSRETPPAVTARQHYAAIKSARDARMSDLDMFFLMIAGGMVIMGAIQTWHDRGGDDGPVWIYLGAMPLLAALAGLY
jgi:hypothetical protein